MSAECNIHGTDLLYGEDDWQAPSYCPSCDLERVRASNQALREALEALSGRVPEPSHFNDVWEVVRAYRAFAAAALTADARRERTATND